MTFSACAGTVHALFASEHAPARDALLAIAGVVRPTSGSLVVCDVERARPKRSARWRLEGRRASAQPHAGTSSASVGLGIFTDAAPVAPNMTVEESVAHEAALRGARGLDVLAHLAELGLATMAAQRVDRLDACGCARLSAALALAGEPKAAVIDLTDEAVAGLPVASACALLDDVRACARRMRCAVVVATSERACAQEADAVTPLDIAAAEQLASAGGEQPAGAEFFQQDQPGEVVA